MGLRSVVRWLRAAAFAASCAGLAAAGHLIGGGAVDPPTLLLGFLIIFVPGLLLTARERTLATILPAVALSQVVLHVLLTRSAAETAPAPFPDPAVAAPHHGGSPGLAMFLMHTVSVLVTAWWLEYGEARLCGLARQLALWVLRPLLLLIGYAAPGDPSRPSVWFWTRPRPVVAVLRHSVVGRGPPASGRPGTIRPPATALPVMR
ncbi:hypothetical protein SAMN04489712_105436 [Thermomonospora echinospora]|uniref:Integral membrane protein n=1 Tax=Thermomonospora echinospora TaxID=1992 RepID=A0A1H6AHT5_9ACTN|nr:hypothetical protein [Thermomonospora echinospora]SEG47714.1 hypothetical protein SAMN04489712_105436 [Thermomonospora echinospora]